LSLPEKSPLDLAKRGLIYNRMTLPAKEFHNDAHGSDMELLKLYTQGPMKFENTGRTCRECGNYYPAARSRYGGRCKARGYMDVHPDTPADARPKGWTHPVEGIFLPDWPECPYFTEKSPLSSK
jgi:hypothetical protein